jgi:hypothetical protein
MEGDISLLEDPVMRRKNAAIAMFCSGCWYLKSEVMPVA